ncbi:MAG TPA: NmrA family NAD(P)-binding protein, partial [Phycisphaerae bacterium]|nr:NmrA family NAD(P)-binding protein [Phycisphaerae bacterium]HQE29037.1 NmrA family NAD(P)-binding protein [Phycisphaerae bacterium]
AGFDTEIAQGTLVAEVARSSGVQHFVYSSVASADRSTGLAHFDSKWIIEQRIHELGLPFTILRPVFFMENWETVRGHIVNGALPQPLDPDCPLQQIATDDIGAVATLAFCNAGRWLGRVVELAGEELTMRQTAETFSRVLGRPVEYVQVPWDTFAQATSRETARMYRWFQDVGYQVDIPALRQECPDLKTLDQFLHEQPWVRAEISAGSYV